MKTRSLTEGAMLGAITVLLTIIGEYLGLPALIVPVPLMLLVHRHGFHLGILTAAVAALVSSLVAGHVFSGLSIIIWGFVGVAVGMALREKFSFPKLMAVGVLSNTVVVGLHFLLYSLIFGENVLTEMVTMLVTSIEQAMQVSEGLGLSGEALLRYEQLLEFAPFLLRWGLPALLLIYAVAMSFLHLAVARLILRRLGDQVPWIAPFTKWRLSPFYSMFLFAGLLVTVWDQVAVLPSFLRLIGLNLFILFFHTYLVLGLGIIWAFYERAKIPKALRFLSLLLLFGFGSLAFFVVLLAVVDGIFDLRGLKTASAKN